MTLGWVFSAAAAHPPTPARIRATLQQEAEVLEPPQGTSPSTLCKTEREKAALRPVWLRPDREKLAQTVGGGGGRGGGHAPLLVHQYF